MPNQHDLIIIGGGIVGCMTARFLSRYQLNILPIEKRDDIGSVSSAANTALIHPGYNAVTGSLKAKMNLIANPIWTQLSEELNFAFDRCGDYVVAIGAEELPKLDALFQRGRENGVTGMSLVSGDELRRFEPLINPDVSGASSPRLAACVILSVRPSQPLRTPSSTASPSVPTRNFWTSSWKKIVSLVFAPARAISVVAGRSTRPVCIPM